MGIQPARLPVRPPCLPARLQLYAQHFGQAALRPPATRPDARSTIGMRAGATMSTRSTAPLWTGRRAGRLSVVERPASPLADGYVAARPGSVPGCIKSADLISQSHLYGVGFIHIGFENKHNERAKRSINTCAPSLRRLRLPPEEPDTCGQEAAKSNLTGWLDDCRVKQSSKQRVNMKTLGSQVTPEEQLLKVLKALSEKTRLRIIQMVSKGDVPCSEIVSQFDMTGPSLSHHFKILQDSGLLITEKRGQSHFHSLNTELLENAMTMLSKTAGM